MELEREQDAVPGGDDGERGENQKADEIVEQVLVVFEGERTEEPLAEGAWLHLHVELEVADLAAVRVRLREPLLQAALVHEAHGARAVARLHERLSVRGVADAAQNGRVDSLTEQKKKRKITIKNE